jgi:hypothetical protein
MSESSQKVIKINPEFFKIPSGAQTKKNIEKKIKVKDSGKTLKNSVNKNILKHIREKQDELYNNIIESNRSESPTANQTFQSEFDKALNHLDDLAKKEDTAIKPKKNRTLKTSSAREGGAFQPMYSDNVGDFLIPSAGPSIRLQPQPTYGCLKGGKLPTFRTWKQSFPEQKPVPIEQNLPIPNDIIQNMNEISQLNKEKEKGNQKKEKKITKQKKTLKRTFKVGKSKFYPKIGVLISNRSIRTQTLKKTQQIKQTPISEIRKFLVKKGLIKVGSTAPNDVLREMYKSVSLIVGDVQNHNVETILYNYLHQ